MMILLFNLFNKPKPVQEKLITVILSLLSIREGKVGCYLRNDVLRKYTDGRISFPANNAYLRGLIEKSGSSKPEEKSFLVLHLYPGSLILLVGVWIFFMRQMQSGGGKPCLSARAAQSC
jgi:cell division protease FtsH